MPDDNVKRAEVPVGGSFRLENTTPGGLDVAIRTPRGTVIRVSLPPGGVVVIDPVFENLKMDALTGAPPGIVGADEQT